MLKKRENKKRFKSSIFKKIKGFRKRRFLPQVLKEMKWEGEATLFYIYLLNGLFSCGKPICMQSFSRRQGAEKTVLSLTVTKNQRK